MKKFYSKMIVAAAMFFAGNALHAQTTTTFGDLQYLIYNGDKAMVAAPATTLSGEVVIPQTATLEGKDYTVTGIANLAFKECTGITKVTLPSTMDSIEYQAFNGCTKLETINLQDTKIRTLCVSTFLYCSALKEITIPATVTTVETNPFMSTSSLKEIKVAEGNTAYVSNDGILYTKDMKYLVSCPGGKDSAVIPEGVEVVGTHAFKSTLVKTVQMPSTLKEIETYGFWQASELTKIELPANIQKIRSSAFAECKKAVGEIIIPSSVTLLQAKAFYYTAITKIEIPGTIATIPTNICQYCTKLREVKLNEGTTSIGNYAFDTCAISSITIPNSVTKIGNTVFQGCTLLKEVTLGEKVKTIATQTFYNLTGITKITSLNPVPPTIDDYASYAAFTDQVYQNCEVTVPAEGLDAYKENSVWKKFAKLSAITSGVNEEVANSVSVVKVNGGLAILGADDADVQVYNLNGMLVYKGLSGVVELPAGAIYVVRVAGKTYKVAL